jgi:hypothetical protein
MRIVLAMAIALGLATSGIAQSKGRGGANRPPAGSVPGSTRSNAPAGTPAASADRDHGRDRAAEVGKGKQKGLNRDRAVRGARPKGRPRR